MEWFGEIVTNHVSGGAVFYLYFFGIDPVGDKKIADVDVASSFAA